MFILCFWNSSILVPIDIWILMKITFCSQILYHCRRMGIKHERNDVHFFMCQKFLSFFQVMNLEGKVELLRLYRVIYKAESWEVSKEWDLNPKWWYNLQSWLLVFMPANQAHFLKVAPLSETGIPVRPSTPNYMKHLVFCYCLRQVCHEYTQTLLFVWLYSSSEIFKSILLNVLWNHRTTNFYFSWTHH